MNFSQLIDTEYTFNVKNPLLEEQVPEGKYLFNTLYYLRHQSKAQLVSFALWNNKRKQAVAMLYVVLLDTIAVSPWRATFGGIEIEAGLPNEFLDQFIQHVNIYLKQIGIASIKITNSPLAYEIDTSQQITAALLRNGYTIQTTEVNYHIPVSNDSLENRIHPSEKRRLRKCLSASFVFHEEKAPDLPLIHAFIKRARLRKGFPMTLPLDTFQEIFVKMPDIYRVFTVKHNEEIVALTVTVRINKDILYSFYPADHESFLQYSPTVILTTELYKVAQNEGYRLLDLGIATDQGSPNYGLMRFKSNLGGENSLRFSFQKTLLSQ